MPESSGPDDLADGAPVTLRPSLAAVPRYRPGRPAVAGDGPPPVKLSANESTDELDGVAASVCGAADDLRHYPDPGSTALRSAIAECLGVEPVAVMTGCGSVGLIQQLLLAFTSRGDVVVSPWISFEAYPILCRLADAEFVPVPLIDETADLDAVASVVESRGAKAVLVADPNNPTGTAVDPVELDAFLARIDRSVLVVLDQAYAEFVTPERRPRPPAALLDDHPNLIVLRTFSKAFALAGLRVGYGIGSAAMIDAANAAALPFAVSSIAQAAALDAWTRRDEVTERCDRVRHRRVELEDALRAAGYSVPTGEANFVWVPTSETEQVGGALDRAGLITRIFDGVGVRITVGTDEDNARVLDVMAAVAPRSAGPRGEQR